MFQLKLEKHRTPLKIHIDFELLVTVASDVFSLSWVFFFHILVCCAYSPPIPSAFYCSKAAGNQSDTSDEVCRPQSEFG